MRPLPGMAVIAEYTTRFSADVAVALLWDSGYEATILSDPAHSVAPHHVTDPMFLVVVREQVADHASEILIDEAVNSETEQLDAQYHHRPFHHRPAWFRWAAWSVFWSIPGLFILAILMIAWVLLDGLFP